MKVRQILKEEKFKVNPIAIKICFMNDFTEKQIKELTKTIGGKHQIIRKDLKNVVFQSDKKGLLRLKDFLTKEGNRLDIDTVIISYNIKNETKSRAFGRRSERYQADF